ncbi:cell wall-binding repeat-containing protein [Peptacetobacter sp.]|uniref:cell wall-binding repeat-containing protein n=1 Tax=Peptacetobacter sp. TaxID=2991975 RepID=UPI003AB49C0E
MNKNRNKVAAMMMVAAITVSSVAMPVEAAVSSIESVGIEREGTVDQEIKDVVLNKVNFPDDAFRERLAEKFKIPNDGTGVITAYSIKNTTMLHFYDDSRTKITNLTGIEKFVNLNDFICSEQNINKADFSGNKKLKKLRFNNNNTSELNISNINLQYLECYGNRNIQNLDLSSSTELTNLEAYGNNISSIKLDQCEMLTEINLNGNSLKSIDLTRNKKLLDLGLSSNKDLVDLKLNKDNSKITKLNISYTAIKAIDLLPHEKLIEFNSEGNNVKNYNFSSATNLETLNLRGNEEISELNLSTNTKLQQLELSGCTSLEKLNAKECLDLVSINVNGTKLKSLDLPKSNKLQSIGIRNNSGLGYINLNENALTKYPESIESNFYNINVDSKRNYLDLEELFPGINMSKVDVKTEGVTKKDDGKLELGNKKPREVTYVYNTGGNHNTIKMTVNFYLNYNLPDEGVILNESNFKDENFRKRITEITGVQENQKISSEQISRIKELNIRNSNIKTLDGIEFFTALEVLDCYNNNLTELDLRRNTTLKEIDFENNLITKFKLPSDIQVIRCGENLFTELDLSEYKNLRNLDCGDNKNLKSINVSNNKQLEFLNASKTGINNINLLQNENLSELYLNGNNLENINLENNINLTGLYLGENKLKEIELKNNTKLQSLSLKNNELTNIDLSKNIKLMTINLRDNKLKNLDLSKNELIDDISDMSSISGTEGKLLVSDSTQQRYSLENEISFNLNNSNFIDLNKEFGITQEEIDNNRIKINTDGLKFNGTKLEWLGKTPDIINYTFNCGGKRDEVKLNVILHLENGKPDKPTNPDQGGGSGGGTTTPDQKPDEKPNKPNKPGNITSKIVGKNRYETAAKIADELVKNNVSYNSVILVNSDKSMADGLSAASLSGKKNAPILLVKKDSIPAEAMAKIEKAKNVYIIGGEGAISKKVENQLKGKNITRISGKDRYETSAKIANMLGGYKMAFIVNGAKGEADAMSVSSVAAKYGAPILLTNGKTSTHPIKAGVSYFVIGGRGVVSNQLADKYNADRIAGIDRYSTNRKVIDEFYYDSKKVYFAKGDTLVDALTASLLAKENGMVLVSKNANHKKLEGKEAVQVGGMDFEISFE